MAGNRVQPKLLFNTFRRFHRSTIYHESEINKTLNTAPKAIENKEKKEQGSVLGARDKASIFGSGMFKLRPIDKRLLLWFKEYKSIDDIPESIGYEKISKIHSKARIYLATIIMGLALGGFLWAVISGKRAVESGDTLQKRMADYHKRIKESK